jgi:hypothetical protein
LKIVSNYVSVTILLMITMILTAEYAHLIYNKANIIHKTIMGNRYRYYGFQEYVLNKTKIIVVNETMAGKIISIRGNHEVIMNTSNIVILLAPINEEITIITARDFYVG